MTNFVETAITNGTGYTLGDIASDLNSGNWDALYFISEEQVDSLINLNMIDSEFWARHQDYQEEKRCLINDAI